MAKLNLTLPQGEVAVTGKQVTITAPCNSEGITHLIIDGVEFELVDSNDRALNKNDFVENSMVSFILNVESKKAYIQNASARYEEWTFYLEDGTTVTKAVCVR